MSRVKKALKNIKYSMFFYILFVVIQFVSRKIFLDNLGDEFIGLVGTLQSFLQFLNLAELGIGTAVGFSLYKPIFEKDEYKINELISLFGFLYKKIGFIILSIGIILSLFFPLIFSSVTINLSVVYFAFYTFLFGLCLNFFFNYHLFLLEADQKNYVITSYAQTLNLFKIGLQSIAVLYFDSFYIWISLELIYSIVFSASIRYKISKEYPWLDLNRKTKKSILKAYPELIKKVKQISVHKLGSFVTSGTDQILIFAFISIESVAFFGNYQLIFNRLLQLVNTTFAGTGAGIGNLVAENDIKNIKKVFWEMMSLRFYIAGITIIVLYFLVQPFIHLWLGEKYILENSVLILFLLNMFIMQIRVPVDHFKDAYGLFQDVWAPVIQSIINLVTSIILLQYFGLAGILMGTLSAFLIIIMIWRPFYLFKFGFEENFINYWIPLFKLIISLFIAYTIASFLIEFINSDHIKSFLNLFFFGIKVTLLTITIYTPLIFTFNKGFRDITKRLLKLITK
tara:strand:+ start:1120 stop:2649 length:1530 start_codon:yes stop_codon:yes gene_type:complete